MFKAFLVHRSAKMPKTKRSMPKGCTFLICCGGIEPEECQKFDEFEDTTLARGRILLQKYEEAHRPAQFVRSSDCTSSWESQNTKRDISVLCQDTSFVSADHQVSVKSVDLCDASTQRVSKSVFLSDDQRPEVKVTSQVHIQASYKDEEMSDTNRENNDDVSESDGASQMIQQEEENNADDISKNTSTNTDDSSECKNMEDLENEEEGHHDDDDNNDDGGGDLPVKSGEISIVSDQPVTYESRTPLSSPIQQACPPSATSRCPAPPSSPMKTSIISRASKPRLQKDTFDCSSQDEPLPNSDPTCAFKTERADDSSVANPDGPHTTCRYPVSPSDPLKMSNIVRASKPCLPKEHFTFISKVEKLQSPSVEEPVDNISVKRGTAKTELLGVFVASSDSSLMATYSGSSSDPELFKLIDFNKVSDTSEEKLSNGATCNPDRMFNIEPEILDSSVKITDVSETLNIHPLGASPLVLGPIATAKETPQQNEGQKSGSPSLTKAELPAARRLDFHHLSPSRFILPKVPVVKASDEDLDSTLARRKPSRAKKPSAKGILQTNSPQKPSTSSMTKAKVTFAPQVDILSSPPNRATPHATRGRDNEHWIKSKVGAADRESSDSSSNDDNCNQKDGIQSKKASYLTRVKFAYAPEVDFHRLSQTKVKLPPSQKINDNARSQLRQRKILPPNIETSDSSANEEQTTAGPQKPSSLRKAPVLDSRSQPKKNSSRRRSTNLNPTDSSTSDEGTSSVQRSLQPNKAVPKQRDHETTSQRKPTKRGLPNGKNLFPNDDFHDRPFTIRPAWDQPTDISSSQSCSRNEQIRERYAKASTSSLPPPLPPPDLLAPTLFKRRAGQGLPPVTGKAPPPKNTSNVTQTRRDGKTSNLASQNRGDRFTYRARTKF